MTVGLVIGKFYPLHRGHQFLIEAALAQVDVLEILVCERPDQKITGQQRASWIRELYPDSRVRIASDICDDDNSEAWAQYTREILGHAPDVVFTSEDYGERYAAYLGCKHILVDRQRTTVPISGTKIRESPLKYFHFLAPCVRAFFVKRISVLGAESTGTTTLARDLAAHYKTIWVPEYGRDYYERKLTDAGEMSLVSWTTEDFLEIATTQVHKEDELAREANRLLICDTDALATAVWHERYMGIPSKEVEAISANRHYDLYILTDCDIPFVQDGTRDGEHLRKWMTERFKAVLTERRVPWLLVSGNEKDRLFAATAAIDKALGRRS